MAGRVIRGAAALLALLVASGPIAACASSSGYAEIRRDGQRRNVPLPTTTIVASTLPTTTTTTSAPPAPVRTPDAALASVVGALASDPTLVAAIGGLRDADPASLAMLFGLDEHLVAELGLTLEQVQGLAAILIGLADGTGSVPATFAAASGPAVEGAVGQLLELAASVDGAALAAIDALTSQVVGSVVGTVVAALDRVDPTLLTVLRALLEYLDPAGLGALASDADDAALLAVFAGATMRAAPDLAPRLRAEVAGDPRATSLVDRLEDIGSEMPRRDALTLTALGARMTPEGFAALERLVDVVRDPSTAQLLAAVRGG